MTYLQRVAYSDLSIREGSFTVRTLTSEKDFLCAYSLRHRIFCLELGWRPRNEDSLEVDDYDDNSVSFGVFNGEGLLSAYLRLITPGKQFMIEKEFLSLIDPGHAIRKGDDTAEISRLCIAPEARRDRIYGNFGVQGASMMLYKGVYRWCLSNGIRYLYLVVENKVLRLLVSRGFPCRLVGESTMPDGVRAAAALMDWREFETLNGTLRPEFLKWFTLYQEVQAQTQQPRPEPLSRHRAYA